MPVLEPGKPDDDTKQNRARTLGIAFMIPVHLAVCIALPTWFGSWLDNRFNTGPWLLLVCLFLGIAAGFKQVVELIRKIQ